MSVCRSWNTLDAGYSGSSRIVKLAVFGSRYWMLTDVLGFTQEQKTPLTEGCQQVQGGETDSSGNTDARTPTAWLGSTVMELKTGHCVLEAFQAVNLLPFTNDGTKFLNHGFRLVGSPVADRARLPLGMARRDLLCLSTTAKVDEQAR